MSKLRLLDCTLRDGGYINQWKFGKDAIKNIIFNLSKSNVDIIECGFLTSKKTNSDCSLYNSVEELVPIINKQSDNVMYVAMIAMGEMEMDPHLLSDADKTPLDGIRLTFHQKQTEKAFEWAKIIMNKGYKLFMQPVGTTNYTDKEFIDLIEKINQLKPYAFYIVDTLGIMYKNDLIRQVFLVDNNLDQSINVGYHSHNNFQQSFSNAQALAEYKTNREIIVDCSANGMGRGAGNLCSELIMDFLNKNYDSHYDILPVLEIIDRYLVPIYLSNPWGYSSAYFLSAANNCHPNYSAYLIAKHTLSMPAISNILQQLPFEKKRFFDKSLIEEIYLKYQSHACDDMETINSLRKIFDGRDVMVISPGMTTKTHKKIIKDYVEQKKPLVISVNFIPDYVEPDYVFIGNGVRYEQHKDNIDLKKTIFTSNINNLPNEANVVNYSELINASSDASDSSGIMVLHLLKKASVSSVALAGYDGFSQNPLNNYSSQDLCGLYDYDQLKEKNEAMKEQLGILSEKMIIKYVTPSIFDTEKAKKE